MRHDWRNVLDINWGTSYCSDPGTPTRIQDSESSECLHTQNLLLLFFYTLIIASTGSKAREAGAPENVAEWPTVHIWNSNSLFARLFSFRTLGFYFLQKLLLVKLPSRLGKTPCGTACMGAAVGQPIDPTCCTDDVNTSFWHTTYHMFLLFYWPIIEGQ